ncbi:helix-turn-helix transcriptional regulator [uncultured Ruminococcus sp.]|uniref:helix-turn-helix domain-containing protein n=1 Tax=uncultured Ruminococcus sp. TaxID=165186 RepID=UPI0025E9F94C|nr:helix-turn-helix transcriptional regulator [uncultured Ruminococcus sp.]
MNRLKQLRQELNKSMADVARELHIPYTTYVNYEKEVREPNSETLIEFANYFSCSVDYLICRSDNREVMTDVREIELTRHEKKLVVAYRNKPEMQPAIDKLLNINDDSSEEYVTVLTAARSDNNRPIEQSKLHKDKLELLRSAKTVKDDSDL